jgi:hypothetical protein
MEWFALQEWLLQNHTHHWFISYSISFNPILFFQVADFGLAHASKDGSICFEPVNTDIRGTPGSGIKYLCSNLKYLHVSLY